MVGLQTYWPFLPGAVLRGFANLLAAPEWD
jgi:hypothetical protein